MGTRRLRTWHSDRVGKEMTVARWGWYGTPVILFPTAAADCPLRIAASRKSSASSGLLVLRPESSARFRFR